jgi:hypothetical protein
VAHPTPTGVAFRNRALNSQIKYESPAANT